MKNVSALSTMKGRGPFKAPAFQLQVPNKWGEGGGRLKRGREGGDWEEEGARDENKRGRTKDDRERMEVGKENDGDDDGDWISLLESSNVRTDCL